MSKNHTKSNTSGGHAQKTDKFAQFDDAIISAIRAGRDTFSAMWTPEMKRMTRALLSPSALKWLYQDDERVLDRRLQALRKEGRIAFINKRWQCKDQPAMQEREEGHA